MSLFDLQDVCIAIGSIVTLDLPMIVDLIGIYGLKGPYCTLTTTNWFLQTLSVIPTGSWGDVARRSYHDPLGRNRRILSSLKPPSPPPCAAAAAARLRWKIVSGQFDEENPFVLISSVLLLHADEGVLFLVVIGDIYRNLPIRADVIVTTVGARHKCQQVVSEPVFFGSDHTNCRIVSNIEFQIKTAEISSHIDRPAPPHAAAPRRAPSCTLNARWPRACRVSDDRSLRARRASWPVRRAPWPVRRASWPVRRASWPVRRAPGRASGRAALRKSLRGWSSAAAREEGGAGRDVARWGEHRCAFAGRTSRRQRRAGCARCTRRRALPPRSSWWWCRRPAAAPASLRRCRDGWYDFF
ncbi:hypothetical protein F511_16115 [Dorcoceras hygrometricum]|uniref:Uncharacterized protein n=1 Tax=Dorcoceras hygrometricum TaxID=472368 RepID=A0A2Z7D7Q2_9LAMI|nr:hypothetical protein F511_16115 [Dorcoceras hygrometricum]